MGRGNQAVCGAGYSDVAETWDRTGKSRDTFKKNTKMHERLRILAQKQSLFFCSRYLKPPVRQSCLLGGTRSHRTDKNR